MKTITDRLAALETEIKTIRERDKLPLVEEIELSMLQLFQDNVNNGSQHLDKEEVSHIVDVIDYTTHPTITKQEKIITKTDRIAIVKKILDSTPKRVSAANVMLMLDNFSKYNNSDFKRGQVLQMVMKDRD